MALCSSNNSSLSIDLNLTSICDMGCLYCSEAAEPDKGGGGCDLSTLYLSHTQVKLQTLIDGLSKDKSKHKTINFWGGEPLINWNYAKAVMNHYKSDSTFSFFFYTNGTYVEKLLPEIKELNDEFGRLKNVDGRNRLIIQVSYDGKWLSDNVRVTKNGQGTADRTLNAYRLLKSIGVSTSLKSVIGNEGYAHLFDSYIELYNEQGFYGPTPDLWSDGLTSEQYKILGEQLEKIASYMYANNISPDTFTWFSKSKAMCSVGVNMTAIDLDGSIMPCHGAMYGEANDHRLGDLSDFGNVVQKSKEKFTPLFEFKPLECQMCDVNFCMKCEVANYAKSTKETYDEKWTDYQANSTCRLFKFVDKFNKTIRFLDAERAKK